MGKKIFRIIYFTLGIIGALVLSSGCTRGEDSWAQIQEEGVLRIGVDPTFPPFVKATDDTVKGIDIDLGRALARELGLEPRFSHFGYDGLYDALITGQVDVLISALVIVPERTQDIAYTTPYFDAGLYLFIPGNGEASQEVDLLGGSSIAVELGSLGHVEALDWQKQVVDLKVLPYADIAEALTAAADGEADAALVDYVSGRLFLRDHPVGRNALNYRPIEDASEPYAMAVRIEDEILLAELNAALGRLAASNQLTAIIEKHLGPE